MPTLLQLNCTANWGSTGKIAEQIGLKTKVAGWDCYMACGRSSNPSQLQVIKVGNKPTVLWHYAENRLLDNEGLASRWATRQLVKQIEAIKPDVIQLHNIHDHWLNYRILFEYLNATDIPVVWTFHDCWAFTGHCPHFVTVNCEKWKTGCFECPLNNSLLDRSQRNYQLKKQLFSANKNLHVVTVSQWLHDFVKQSFLRDKDVSVIHNGIDVNRFGIKPAQKEGKFVVLGVATAWSESKGLGDYIKLSERLDDDCQIVLVGLREQQIRALPKKIIGLPKTKSQEELAELYQKASVVLSLSRAETFGLTIAEGMACGTPAIVYDNTAQPELITPETGMVVKTGDIDVLVSAIRRLKEHPLSADDCRKRAEACFDKDRCFGEYVELYRELLGKR